MNLIVIHELDLSDKDHCVIGVADSVKNAELIISKYYGEFKEISFQDIRDSNLEYSKVIELNDISKNAKYRVKIYLEWFELNII